MSNIFAFVECCYKNHITRTGYILITLAALLFSFEMITIAFIVLFYGTVSVLLTGFGFTSYHYYKRSFNNLINKRENIKPYGYCGHIGCQIAMEKFNRTKCK